MRRVCALLAPLTACDLGTLVGTDAVHALGELGGIPEDPAWDFRWYRGDKDGVASGCPLVTAEDIDPQSSDANVISDGTLYVPPPEPAEPAFWLEGDDYRWAFAFVVLTDRKTYEPPATLEWEDGERVYDDFMEEDGPWLGEGAWGGAEDAALLYVEGDASQFVLEKLDLEDDVDLGLGLDGPTWVGLLPEMVELTGGITRAFYPLGQQQEEEGLRLKGQDFLSEAGLWTLSGTALGGLTEDCQ